MGDHTGPKSAAFLLPPGCRFHPSEDQLLCYYLTNKTAGGTDPDGDEVFQGHDLIGELDVYGHDPFELPDSACYSYGCGGRRRHWYCYARVRVVKGRRRAKNGYWRRGRVREVMGRGGAVVVGMRTSFVFYLGNSPKNSVRTDWVLYEYALVDNLKASFVLCRVFTKFRGGNSMSDNVLSSCAGVSDSAVRHIGIQHDEILTSDTVRSKVCDENFVDKKNEIPGCGLDSEPDDQIKNRLVRLSGLNSGGAMFADAVEDDFIELDDLIGPLSGTDCLK